MQVRSAWDIWCSVYSKVRKRPIFSHEIEQGERHFWFCHSLLLGWSLSVRNTDSHYECFSKCWMYDSRMICIEMLFYHQQPSRRLLHIFSTSGWCVGIRLSKAFIVEISCPWLYLLFLHFWFQAKGMTRESADTFHVQSFWVNYTQKVVKEGKNPPESAIMTIKGWHKSHSHAESYLFHPVPFASVPLALGPCWCHQESLMLSHVLMVDWWYMMPGCTRTW